MNSRLLDGAGIFYQMVKYLLEKPVDEIVFCGDLFHTHGKLNADVLKVAFNGFDHLGLVHNKPSHITALVGNHDTSDMTMKTHGLHWLEACGVNIIDAPVHNRFNGLPSSLSFLPYTEDKEAIKKFFDKCGDFCFLHQGIANVPMGSGFVINEILTADMIPDHVKHVFTGHYHQHNRVSDTLTIVGSPMQLTWADEGDKRGFIVYDTNTGEIEHIESTTPKFVTIDWNDIFQTTIDEEVKGNFVRVKGVSVADAEAVRKEITEAGARSVEFIQDKEGHTMLNPITTCNGFHLPSLVAEYEKQKVITPECARVGKELMR
jgi:DNA repair exonuclease SbcCD nuclease subunit